MNLPNPTLSLSDASGSNQANHLMEALFDSSILAIGLFDVHLRLQRTNAPFIALFEGTDLANPGTSLMELPLEEPRLLADELQELANGHKDAFVINVRLTQALGRPCYLQLKVQGCFEDGRFTGGALFVEDCTQQRNQEEGLREKIYQLSLKYKSLKNTDSPNVHLNNFAHMASHDMKEPLRMICNFSKLIERRMGDQLDPVSKEYMDYVVGGAHNINTLVKNLMSYTAVCQQEPRRQPVQTEDVFLLLQREMEEELAAADAQLKIGDMPASIVADQAMLKVVFKKLIHNALKFRSEDRPASVEVRGMDMGPFWQFQVTDNGIGIQREFQDQVFELFKRLHSKHQYPGSGIGLSIAGKIVTKHGGKMWVESEYGRGSTFYLTISR
ncbi:MAG: ATP-binding protein [Bacteroidota bacterium]